MLRKNRPETKTIEEIAIMKIATGHPSNDNGSPVEPSATTPNAARAPAPASRRAWRWLVLLIAPVAAGALSMSVARAHGFGGGDRGEGHMGGAFMQQRMDQVLTAVGATDAQKTQIKAIWEPLRPQLRTLHQQQADVRHQLGEAVAASTIDTARVEQLRKQSVQAMDRISTVMTQGMVASAQILTPEQRKAVLQKMEEHRGRGPGRGNGGNGNN